MTKTTMGTADAQGRARPSEAALAAANAIADYLGNELIADSMVLDFADILDRELKLGTVTLLDKDYDYESLYDLSRDVGEAMDENFTEAMKTIPTDKDNMCLGTFHLRFDWRRDED